MTKRYVRRLALAVLATATIAQSAVAQVSQLAKQSQNPIANLISLPLQNNTDFGIGPTDAVRNTLNIQPVYPVSREKFNIINRVILPVVYTEEVVPGTGSEFGLGDTSYTAFFTPSKPSKVTWGVGPSFIIPTSTDDRLGAGEWAVGAGAVVLTMPGKWVIGGLVQNVWGDGVNTLLAQYFISYMLGGGWYLTTAPIITANWEADSDNTWTVPFGGGAGRVFAIGKQKIDAQVSAYTNVEKPDIGGADWQLRLQVKWLFPKSN